MNFLLMSQEWGTLTNEFDVFLGAILFIGLDRIVSF